MAVFLKKLWRWFAQSAEPKNKEQFERDQW